MRITKIPAKPKEEEKIIRVAAYARVSVDKDASFHSLEAQTEYYRAYVGSHPVWKLVGIYSDNGVSGTIIDRPEFQRMLTDCRNEKIDLIISKSITRFARNTVILLETIRELKALGIDCFFEKENIHSISADGELLITLLAMYAEEEARSASENQRWRIQKRFEAGEPWVGNMLGYRLIDGHMVIVREEADLVRRIFTDYLSGMGKQSIAKKCQKMGCVTPMVKQWYPTTIARILTNEKYTGNMVLQKTYRSDFRTKKRKTNHGEVRRYYVENSHEAIISLDMFEAVQAEMKRRKSLQKGGASRGASPFQGLLVCGICGHHFFRRNQKRGLHHSDIWVCNTYFRRGKAMCPSLMIPESILIEMTCEVLGVTEITREILTESLCEIRVPGHNRLSYVFKNGTIKEIVWKHPSRSQSWTPQMREQARARALAKSRKEEKHE